MCPVILMHAKIQGLVKLKEKIFNLYEDVCAFKSL